MCFWVIHAGTEFGGVSRGTSGVSVDSGFHSALLDTGDFSLECLTPRENVKSLNNLEVIERRLTRCH